MTLALNRLYGLLVDRGKREVMAIIAAVCFFIGSTSSFKSPESQILASRIFFFDVGAQARECGNLAMHNVLYYVPCINGFLSMVGQFCYVPTKSVLLVGQLLVSQARKFSASGIAVSVAECRSDPFPIHELFEFWRRGIINRVFVKG